MEKQFFCYRRSRDGVFNVSYSSAGDLLLRYLNKNGINYYCGGEEGNSFQLYYRLRSTGFRIRQSIVVGKSAYHCTTRVVERTVGSSQDRLKILSWVNVTNKQLGRRAFVYDYGEGQLKYINSLSLGQEKGVLNIEDLSGCFDRLIGQPHYLLDIEYADFLCSILK